MIAILLSYLFIKTASFVRDAVRFRRVFGLIPYRRSSQRAVHQQLLEAHAKSLSLEARHHLYRNKRDTFGPDVIVNLIERNIVLLVESSMEYYDAVQLARRFRYHAPTQTELKELLRGIATGP